MRPALLLMALFVVVVLLFFFSSQSLSPTAASDPVASDNDRAKAVKYMSCLGFAPTAADDAWKATHGDMNKFLIVIHLAVAGFEDTPLTPRERTCRKSSGLPQE